MSDSLSIKGLTTGYRRHPVISEMSLAAIPRGKVTVLLGPNGCGKSTLLRALAGLNRAQGEIWLDNQNINRLSLAERGEKVVYLPQSLPSGVHLQVLESVLVSARATGQQGADVSPERILQLLDQVGIASLALRYMDELSGGQKQMVGLAQSLVRNPSLLLLDEPLSALDLNYQYHVMSLVSKETRARNMVTVVVLHDINIALRHSDHVVMMKSGRIVASGAPAEVITPDSLAEVYGVRGRIELCSQGVPQVHIDGLVSGGL
ncbi:ABC transporter ATP-binding protein [Tatumella terrea]|uniref:ABC transporter ATP-binding protein n=1 Tax=Tatumella terrea TaxID=419007 RepID=A0ABW1VSW4_9GAMM